MIDIRDRVDMAMVVRTGDIGCMTPVFYMGEFHSLREDMHKALSEQVGKIVINNRGK